MSDATKKKPYFEKESHSNEIIYIFFEVGGHEYGYLELMPVDGWVFKHGVNAVYFTSEDIEAIGEKIDELNEAEAGKRGGV